MCFCKSLSLAYQSAGGAERAAEIELRLRPNTRAWAISEFLSYVLTFTCLFSMCQQQLPATGVPVARQVIFNCRTENAESKVQQKFALCRFQRGKARVWTSLFHFWFANPSCPNIKLAIKLSDFDENVPDNLNYVWREIRNSAILKVRTLSWVN